MAHHKSAIKRIRTAEKERLMNRMYKRRLKKMSKDLLAAENKQAAEPLFKKIVSLLDRMGEKHILHKNNVAHKKSKYARFFNALPE